MSLLGELLSSVIPPECVSSRSAVREHRRRFSIQPRAGDEICCIELDGCWLKSDPVKRVDYLFLGRSAAGKKLVLLVELKGGNFGKALDQIEATLQFLCRQGSGNVIHNGEHKSALAHDAPENGGVRAYVILSHGRKVGLRSRQVEDIRKRFGVRVYAREGVSVNGLDALPDSDK